MPTSLLAYIAAYVFDATASVLITDLAIVASAAALYTASMYVVGLLVKGNSPTQGQTGTEVQLGPNTDNKLPVAYGSRFCKSVVVDAIISHDQQTMWYVMAISEATPGTVSFGEVFYDGKLLIFNPSNPNTISGWYTYPKKHSKIGGQYNTKPAGKISMWFYRDGSFVTGTGHNTYTMSYNYQGDYVANTFTGYTSVSAVSVLQDSRIDFVNQWDSHKKMENCVFVIVELDYDQNAGIYGLGQIDFKLNNTLNQPGDVIRDYLMSTRYGAGIPLANIDTDSLDLLNYISAQPLRIVDTEGTTVTNSFTYEINGVVDTTQDCLTNLNSLSDACDSWLQWNEKVGKWGVVPNISLGQAGLTTSTMRVIDSSNIIGGIDLTPSDLKSSANQITVSFPNTDVLNQIDYRYYWLEDQFKSPNEPVNNIDIGMPFVSDSIQATYLGYRKLWTSREDLLISFSMDYSGIAINAGDIIAVNHEWYGWGENSYNGLYCPGKPFRVTQVKESKDDKGFLSVQIIATAYNDSIYYTMNPHYYTPDNQGLAVEYTDLPTPIAPLVDTPNKKIYVEVPASGNIQAMELWSSTSTNVADYNFVATIAAPQTFFSSGTVVFYQMNLLPTITGYVAARASGSHTYSLFSDPSAISWVNQSSSASTSTTAANAYNIYQQLISGGGSYYLGLGGGGGFGGLGYLTQVYYNAALGGLNTPQVTTGVTNLTPLSAPPTSFSTGTVAMADNVNWIPESPQVNTGSAILVYWNGSVWVTGP
jgi:hypothetical protein